MSEIRCLVADDEPIARGIVEEYIERVPNLKLVKSCKDAFEVLEALKTDTVDLIFLDINMPQLSGISLIKILPERPNIILTTAYSEFALEGFELSVTDYLLKPFSFERFFQAVSKIQKPTVSEESTPVKKTDTSPLSAPIYVKSDKKLIRLLPEEIYVVEAYGNYIKIHSDGVVLTPQVLSDFLNKLPSSDFLRIHKSFAINCTKIKSLEGNSVILDNGQEVPVSRSYKKDLLERLRM